MIIRILILQHLYLACHLGIRSLFFRTIVIGGIHMIRFSNPPKKLLLVGICFALWSLPSLVSAAGIAGYSTGPVLSRGNSMILGSSLGGAKAPGDSLLLMGPAGSSAAYLGNFQGTVGQPDWNGWTHHDYSVNDVNHWQASTFMAEGINGHGPGNHAAWCGENLLACSASDSIGGYGNNYRDYLIWTGTVSNPNQPCTVTLDGWVRIDVEPGYDYLYLQVVLNGGVTQNVQSFNYPSGIFPVQMTYTYLPGDYVGDNGDEVQIAFYMLSDGAFSDEDCLYPSSGACQLDDLHVQLSNGGLSTFDDFESGLGNWVAEPTLGVGDFSQIWSGLEDVDPCQTNYSPQVAFIDDGLVVPGVGPSLCIDWCYGPFGYIVNNTGGRLGVSNYLDNGVESPVMSWPGSQYSGAMLGYTVYRHEDLASDSPGIFDNWDIRSTSSPNPDDINLEPWESHEFIYYGGPGYYRQNHDITDLLVPGTTFVQIRLGAVQLGWMWGWNGANGTPAPYFDNVRLTAFEHSGPAMSARDIDLAQDNFPASGVIDEQNLGANSVRFDMARNIALATELRNQPGDSLVVNIDAVRYGAQLSGLPRLHYKVLANPLFDPYRTSDLPTQGWVEGAVTMSGGVPIPGRYAFDLPDTGFLFPGDIVHYYFTAEDDLAGDIRLAIMPSDTTGFSDFSDYLSYDHRFTMRALPTISTAYDGTIQYPGVLLWYDASHATGMNEWLTAMNELERNGGDYYDLYYTQGASSGVGNGLGGRATSAQLSAYEVILYDSGDETSLTLGVGDYDRDASQDVQVLDGWLGLGGKGMYLTGNSLVSDVHNGSPTGLAFVSDHLGTTPITSFIRPLIQNQASPTVASVGGNGVLSEDYWLVYGGCPSMPAMDAVEANPTASKLAEYLDPSGNSGVYSFSAATLQQNATLLNSVISMPYAYDRIWNPEKSPGLPTIRTAMLRDILFFLGQGWIIVGGADLPESGILSAAAYPNPFNPRVEIKYQAPSEGDLTVKVFDMQGRLVKVLFQDRTTAGEGKVLWDGLDQSGSPAASGVYFYEVRTADQSTIGKIALVR